MKTFVFLTFVLTLVAGNVQSPSVGYTRTADGTLIRVAGIGGAFVTSATEHSGLVSAGFSGSIGVVKLDSAIRILDADGTVLSESDAPDGAAVIGFNARGDCAIVFYPSTQTMSVFESGEWRPVPFTAAVSAVAIKDNVRALVVIAGENPALLEVRLSDGAVERRDSLGAIDASQVLVWADGSMMFQREDALIYRDKSGNEFNVPGASGVTGLEHMGQAWVRGQAGSGRNLALRPGPEPRVYEIPEVVQ